MGITLLANLEAISSANRYMKHGGPTGNLTYVYITIAGVVLFWIGMFLWDRYRHKLIVKRPESPKSIFAELAAAHKLNRAEKTLILNAVGQDADQKAAICFVDPEIISRQITLNPDQADDYVKLQQRLFGE